MEGAGGGSRLPLTLSMQCLPVPDAALMRGQFVTLLLRAYGIEAKENASDNFSEAGDAYYTGYLAAAKRLGISSGVGGNEFAPEKAITRQEIFTPLCNALKALEKLPEGDSGKTPTSPTAAELTITPGRPWNIP